MAGQTATNSDRFEAYFRRADLDGDGQISGAEAVAFFQGSNLPKQVLAQVFVVIHTPIQSDAVFEFKSSCIPWAIYSLNLLRIMSQIQFLA